MFAEHECETKLKVKKQICVYIVQLQRLQSSAQPKCVAKLNKKKLAKLPGCYASGMAIILYIG